MDFYSESCGNLHIYRVWAVQEVLEQTIENRKKVRVVWKQKWRKRAQNAATIRWLAFETMRCLFQKIVRKKERLQVWPIHNRDYTNSLSYQDLKMTLSYISEAVVDSDENNFFNLLSSSLGPLWPMNDTLSKTTTILLGKYHTHPNPDHCLVNAFRITWCRII